jgi:hypothetical protein
MLGKKEKNRILYKRISHRVVLLNTFKRKKDTKLFDALVKIKERNKIDHGKRRATRAVAQSENASPNPSEG